MRNHYRLVKLYQEKLATIHGEILYLDFEPGNGIPEDEDKISKELVCYRDIPEFKYDMIPHLIATFMKEARNQDNGDKEIRKKLDEIGLETMDISWLDDFFHPDVLLYFLKPCITSEAFIIYQNYLMEYNYENLYDDFATLQLVQTVVGLFWLWDENSKAWRKISEQI